jgi:hypothetical protein
MTSDERCKVLPFTPFIIIFYAFLEKKKWYFITNLFFV